MTSHANSPGWVERESLRLFPLDLSARVAWMLEMSHSHTNEAERHEIIRRIQIIRNGNHDSGIPEGES